MKPVVAFLALGVLGLPPLNSKADTVEARGIQFIPFDSLSKFTKSTNAHAGGSALTSPEIATRIQWDELIASWSADMPAEASLKIEVRAMYPERATEWFTMALWSGDPEKPPRESVRQQKDEDGNVDT